MDKEKEAGCETGLFFLGKADAFARRTRFSIVNRYPRNQRLVRDELELFPEDDDDPLDEELPEDCPDRGAELLPLPPSRRTVGVYARPCVFDRVSLVGVLI